MSTTNVATYRCGLCVLHDDSVFCDDGWRGAGKADREREREGEGEIIVGK